jgi:uncharacterized protein with NRDE domain
VFVCTLIALHRCTEGAHLVVAANRDEYYERAAAPPALQARPAGDLVAPADLAAGGTWLGVNASGLFAAITNRPTAAPDRTRRSRGLVVLDALEESSAAAAAARLAALPRGAYNPFNLLVADREDAFVVVYEQAPEARRLATGVHVIGNADPDARHVPKVARLLDEAGAVAAGPADRVLEGLAEVCRRHGGGGGPLDDTCIHTSVYGTRSSTLLRLGDGLAGGELRFADGAPCQSPYRDLSPLLRELGQSTRTAAVGAFARRAS